MKPFVGEMSQDELFANFGLDHPAPTADEISMFLFGKAYGETIKPEDLDEQQLPG